MALRAGGRARGFGSQAGGVRVRAAETARARADDAPRRDAGGRAGPGRSGSALLEQFQAQVLSALRAAAAAVTAVTDGDGDSGESSSAESQPPFRGSPPPSRTRRAFWRLCRWRPRRSSTAGSPAAIPPRRAGSSTSSSDPPSPRSLDQSEGGTRRTAENIRRRVRGITARLRVATSRALAVAATHAPDALATALAKANVDAPRNRCELWWRRVPRDPMRSRLTTYRRDRLSRGTWRGRPARPSRRSRWPPLLLPPPPPFSTRAPPRFGPRRRRVRFLPESVRGGTRRIE